MLKIKICIDGKNYFDLKETNNKTILQLYLASSDIIELFKKDINNHTVELTIDGKLKNLKPIIVKDGISLNGSTLNNNQNIRLTNNNTLSHKKNIGYKLKITNRVNTLFKQSNSVNLFQVNYSCKLFFKNETLEVTEQKFRINRNINFMIDFSTITLSEPCNSLKFSFIYSVLGLNKFEELGDQFLIKFLSVNRKKYQIDDFQLFLQNIELERLDDDELCSKLRLCNCNFNLIKHDVERKKKFFSNFKILRHVNSDTYINFISTIKTSLDKIVMNPIQFKIFFENFFLKSVNFEICVVKSNVLYRISEQSNIFEIIVIDVNLIRLKTDNLLDKSSELSDVRVNSKFVNKNSKDKSHLCLPQNLLTEFKYTFIVANHINFKADLTKLIEIELIINSKLELNPNQNFIINKGVIINNQTMMDKMYINIDIN
jgi:hypothetical protein